MAPHKGSDEDRRSRWRPPDGRRWQARRSGRDLHRPQGRRSQSVATTSTPILAKYIKPESTLQTDEAKLYIQLGEKFAEHQSVNHVSEEYVRGTAHTNTVEGFYSIFKRGMKGIYQHCDERHLHRYLAEFDFRYSNRAKLGVDDNQRTTKALKGISGKRLTSNKLAKGGDVSRLQRLLARLPR